VFDESMMTGFAFLVEFSPLQKRFVFNLIDVLRDASQEVPAQDSEIVALEVQQADGFVFWKIRRNLVQLLVAAQQLAPSARAGPVIGQVAKVGGVVVLRRWSLLVDVIPVTVRV
jgi:hypothetical protein